MFVYNKETTELKVLTASRQPFWPSCDVEMRKETQRPEKRTHISVNEIALENEGHNLIKGIMRSISCPSLQLKDQNTV